MIIHDRDLKFTKEFTQTVKNAGMKTNPLPKGSPNLNGRCERFIETIKLECLRKFIIFGQRHLDHIISEFVTYYNNPTVANCGIGRYIIQIISNGDEIIEVVLPQRAIAVCSVSSCGKEEGR